MTEIAKKICLLGAFAVGKTSLVGQFVHQKFSDKYLTTMGVKVDRKLVDIGEDSVRLMIWDLAGEDDVRQVRSSYLKGMSGYLLVADSTRSQTVDAALSLHDRIVAEQGALPFALLLNKVDLDDRYDLDDEKMASLSGMGVDVLRTSAKTGVGVDEAFADLARRLLENT